MITKTVLLACGPERAFELFTERAGAWWPADRRHTSDEHSVIRIESSGRFYERARDGTEVEIGFVRRFEPPRRLVLDWYPGTGREQPTQVEVQFEAVEDKTRVTVRHSAGAASRQDFTSNAPLYDRSWQVVLAALRTGS